MLTPLVSVRRSLHYNWRFSFQNRVPVEPSPQFILTYFSAFANDPILNSLGADNCVDSGADTVIDSGADKGEGIDSTESSETSEPEKHQDETPEKEMAAEIMGEDNSDDVKTRYVVHRGYMCLLPGGVGVCGIDFLGNSGNFPNFCP